MHVSMQALRHRQAKDDKAPSTEELLQRAIAECITQEKASYLLALGMLLCKSEATPGSACQHPGVLHAVLHLSA